MLRMTTAVTVAGCLLLAAAPATRAEGDPAADQLFDEGRALITSGQVAAACAKFEASLARDAALGTLLNLGLCWEQLGRVHDAIGALEHVVADATTTALQPFRVLATAHLEALYARRSRLTVTLDGRPEAPVDDVTLTVQRPTGPTTTIGPGVEITLDPSRDASDLIVVVARRGIDHAETRSQPAHLAAGQALVLHLAAPTLVTATRTSGPTHRNHTGLLVAGGGMLALATSGVVAWVAKGRYDDAIDQECTTVGAVRTCSAAGERRTDDAITLARWVATPVAVVGLAAVAVGTYVWLRGSSSSSSKAREGSITIAPVVGVGDLGVVASGAF